MKYMLDTNIIIYAKSNNPEKVLQRFRQYSPGELCISVITLAELEYGVYKSKKPSQNQLALMTFLSNIPVIPFDVNAANEYGKIRSALEREGKLIDANDLLIAAHAKSMDFVLITNNTREFERVEGLKMQNWV